MKESFVTIGVNSPFDLQQFNKNKSNVFQKQLREIYKCKNSLYLSEIQNSEEFDIISINSNRIGKSISDDKLIYEIINKPRVGENNKFIKEYYEINTGIYVGCLIVGNQKLVINSGYNDNFFRLLIRNANNIYVDSKANYNDSHDNYDVFNVLEFLFLSSFKNAISFGVPKIYKTKSSKNWNIKGKIDFHKYFSNDFYKRDGISFTYRELCYDSDILNILIFALKLCNKEYVENSFKELISFVNEIEGNIRVVKPSEITLKKCINNPRLSSGVFSKYKKAIIYAIMIIKHGNLSPSTIQGKKAVGWIVDVSELWEEYIYNLLKKHFSNWNVLAQENLELYGNAFYKRKNYPDIIMKQNDRLVILDAKFKKMDFNSSDVDREDLHQVQSYYGYYMALQKYRIKAVSLIYPTRNNPPENKRTLENMFGIKDCPTAFDISYIKIGENNMEQQNNEKEFINRLRKII